MLKSFILLMVIEYVLVIEFKGDQTENRTLIA